MKRRANPWGKSRGAGRYRDGAVCGIRADGVLWRYHRGDLSSVFYHHCLGNGAVGAGRHDPDTGAVRNVIKTAAQRRTTRATRIFGWFNRTFNRNAERYEKGVAKILHRSLRWILIYVLLLGGMVFLFCVSPPPFCRKKIGACSLRLSSYRAVLRNSRP